MARLCTIVSIWLFAIGCSRDSSAPEGPSEWPYSDAYRGLTPLSDADAGERAVHLCQQRQSLTNGKALSTKAVPSAPEYTEVVVQGTINGQEAERSVLIHKFSAKGDKIKIVSPEEDEISPPTD